MIIVLCSKSECSLGIRVMGSPLEIDGLIGPSSEFWPGNFVCPDCESPARGFLELEVDYNVLRVTRLIDLSVEEAFAAFNGLGLPTEHNCTVETLRELLTSQPVRQVLGRNIAGTMRCTVTRIDLEDNTRIYLGAGAAGACVYRIVRPLSYVEKVDGG